MSDEKFTKGEWEVKPIEDDKEYIRIRGCTLGSRFKIANVIDINYHRDPEKQWCINEREESLANANLIAASPRMYAMLKRLVDHDCINDSSLDKEVKSLLSIARGKAND